VPFIINIPHTNWYTFSQLELSPQLEKNGECLSDNYQESRPSYKYNISYLTLIKQAKGKVKSQYGIKRRLY
jgi:hypothetical protein